MDTVGEILTRIRNAGMAGHDKVDVPSSKLRVGIAKVLQDTGFIRTFKVVDDGKQGVMRLYLKYKKDGKPMISALHRVSSPGKRVYTKAENIPNVRSGYGLAILSTSKGVISGKQANELNIGGEVLCKVW
jgi:small subunit ribosomal protein S8